MSDTKGHTIQVVGGPAGPSLYLDDYRIAGPKPWGGGTVLHEFRCTDRDLIAAGITLAATPAPLDVLRAARELSDALDAPGPRDPIDGDPLTREAVNDAWEVHGLRVDLARDALRAAIKEANRG